MIDIISTIEIASLIILPLILFYQRSNWKAKSYIANVLLIYVIWFFTYALMHELSHIIAYPIVGAKILHYQLIPQFWKGDFKTAYINSNLETNYQGFITSIFPYLRDVILSVIGFLVLRRKQIISPFFNGLIFVFFILSSLYDLINNFSIYILGSMGSSNDFDFIQEIIGIYWTIFIGAFFTVSILVISWRILLIYKDYPENYL